MLAGAIAVGAIALVAYLLWPTWERGRVERPGADADQHRRHPLQRADRGDPHEDPAPFRAAGTRRPHLQLPFARASRGAEACQRRYASRKRCSRSTGSSCRSRRIMTRWRRMCCVRTIYPRYLDPAATPAQDGLTHARVSRRHALRQRRSVRCRHAESQCALHPRRRDPRHVPERAPDRRRRSDVSLSARAGLRNGATWPMRWTA